MTCIKSRNFNLSIDQGATFSRALRLKQDNGAAVDLTGVTITGQVRPSVASAVSYDFTFVIESPATGGIVTWSLTDTQTSAIDTSISTDFVYDVEIEYADTTKQRLLQGNVSVAPEVTR